jgi:Tfp pilus assembly protein PilN
MNAKTALGIDISQSRISLALLRRHDEGVELVRADTVPVPEGAIKNGNIEDAEKLRKAIRELKDRNKIRWTNHAAVSLSARPVVMQIIDMPKPLPANMGDFVRSQVKRCVALSGKTPVFDFCRVNAAREATDRLFVGAADEQRVIELSETCGRAGLNVELVEPPLLAYARALHAKKIAGRFDGNVLIAVLQDNLSDLCVFEAQSLDFVRTRQISEEAREPADLCGWLSEQINDVIRFYDFELADSCDKWEITVIADQGRLPDDAEKSLSADVAAGDIQVRTVENACEDTPVGQDAGSKKTSAVAIGLAMGRLGIGGDTLRINLVPPESAEVRSVKKHFLVTGNVIATLFLIMTLAAGAFTLLVDSVNHRIREQKQAVPSEARHEMRREKQLLDEQIKRLSGKPDHLESLLGSHGTKDWVQILNDVRNRTPKTVRITELRSRKDAGMYLEGLALSYEAVHLFVDLLNKSGYIKSASATQTEKDSEGTGLVRYGIDCLLSDKKKDS